MSDAVLDSMEKDGWTPAQVRALVAAYRELMRGREAVLALARNWKADRASTRKRKCGDQLEQVAAATRRE